MPNPQSALPLPPRPSLERYKKLARSFANACKSGEADAIGREIERWIETLTTLADSRQPQETRASKIHARPADTPAGRSRIDRAQVDHSIADVTAFAEKTLRGADRDNARCRLTDAQFVIARAHGFASWPKFARHLDALARQTSAVSQFEAAADAIVDGDLAALRQQLRDHPGVIRLRSAREHRATLLHYCAANGVENYRQRTPANIVAIAATLLDAGADVDAEADVYGGGATTLGLAATSVHPERAGVQEALLQLLLDRGAAIDHPRGGGNGDAVVLACLANGRGRAAEFLAGHGAILTLESAAGTGRLDRVQDFFDDDGNLKAAATRAQLARGLAAACMYGRVSTVEYLLQRGVDLTAQDDWGQTALHAAVIGGHLAIVTRLLAHRPPLEAVNRFGGTVLGQTMWSAAHGGDPEVYVGIIETLIAAGAQVPERHVPIDDRLDSLLRRYGSEPEESWYWYGEKPRRAPSTT